MSEIVARYDLRFLPRMRRRLPWQEAGLSYTASGYGRKIPTEWLIRIPKQRENGNWPSPTGTSEYKLSPWRRVYCCIYSNIGTCYVPVGDDWVVIEN